MSFHHPDAGRFRGAARGLRVSPAVRVMGVLVLCAPGRLWALAPVGSPVPVAAVGGSVPIVASPESGALLASVPAGNSLAARAWDASGWYRVDLPSWKAPASGWVRTAGPQVSAAYVEENPSLGQAEVQNTGSLGLCVRSTPDASVSCSSASNSLSKLWDGQRMVATGATASGSGCSGPWRQIYLPSGLGASLGWICSAASGLQFLAYLPGSTSGNRPSGLLAAAISESWVSLAWTDNSSNESGFGVERKAGAGGAWTLLARQGSNLNFFNDRSVAPGAEYRYRVRADGFAGVSGYSNEAAVVVPSPPPPPKPPAVSITAPADGSEVSGAVTVRGTASGEAAITRVEVRIDGGAYASADGTLSWQYALDTGRLADGAHTLEVRALDSRGLASSAGIRIMVRNRAACSDPYEPNDSPSPALKALEAGQALDARICAGGDQDYFHIVVDGPGTVAVELSGPEGNQLGAEVADSAGKTVLGLGLPGRASDAASFHAEGPGTFTLRVFSRAPDGDWSYRVKAAFPAKGVNRPPEARGVALYDAAGLVNDGSTLRSGEVAATGALHDPDNDDALLEIEIEGPWGLRSFRSGPAPAGNMARVTASGFPDGAYRWRSRAMDARGLEGAWSGYQSFRAEASADPKPKACGARSRGDNLTFLCESRLDTEPLGERVPVLLIHGICSPFNPNTCDSAEPHPYESVWEELAAAFYQTARFSDLRAKAKLYVFRYETSARHTPPGLNGITAVSGRLRQLIDEEFGGARPLVVVAHSLGVLVARSYMQEQDCGAGQCGNRVARLLAIAGPHHGAGAVGARSRFASAAGVAGGFFADTRKDGWFITARRDTGNYFLRCLNSYLPTPEAEALEPACRVEGKTGFYDRIVAYHFFTDDIILPGYSTRFEGRSDLLGRRAFWNCDGLPHSALPRDGCWAGLIRRNGEKVFDFLHDDIKDVLPADSHPPNGPPPAVTGLFARTTGAGIATAGAGVLDAAGRSGPVTAVLNWSASPNAEGFRIVDADGRDVSGNLPPGAVSWSETGLPPNISYVRRVVAFNGFGASASLPVAYTTPANPPAGLSAGPAGFHSASLTWPVDGNPNGTRYDIFVSSSEAAAEGDFLVSAIGGTAATIPGLLPGTTYVFRIHAVSQDGNLAPWPGTAVLATPELPASVRALYVSGGKVRLELGRVSAALDFAEATQGRLFVSSDPQRSGLQLDPQSLESALVALPRRLPGTVAEAVLYDWQGSAYAGPISGTLTLPYPVHVDAARLASDNPEIQPQDTRLYVLTGGRWIEEPSQPAIDPGKQTLTFAVSRLGVYSLAGPAPALIHEPSSTRIYPVPWRPSDTGQFGSAKVPGCGEGLVMDRLPAESNVRIYTIGGELVRRLSAASDCLAWDGRNGTGREAASGVYLAVIRAPSGTIAVKKFALER